MSRLFRFITHCSRQRAGMNAAFPATRAALLAACVAAGGHALAAGEHEPFQSRAAVKDFASEMEKEHDIDSERVMTLLGSVSTNQSILDAISRPAEKRLTWREYRPIFLKPSRITAGQAFLTEHAELFDAVEERYGVPRTVIAAIIGVETLYGRITGNYQVLEALATLAFDYPPRAKFFRSELVEFLHLTQEEKLDPQAALGSYAGAMGYPQFIASSYRAYAVDFDGDGQRNLFDSLPDIIASVANYLSVHGWRRSEPVIERWQNAESQLSLIEPLILEPLKPSIEPAQVAELGFPVTGSDPVRVMSFAGADGQEIWVGYTNFYAITRYNRSQLYALAVHQLSQAIAGVSE